MSVSRIIYRGVGSLQPIDLPGSKSMAARALIINYIRGVKDPIKNLPDCDDTKELKSALSQLACSTPGMHFNLGTGGTSLRFFTALAASLVGFEGVVDCSEALKKRPLSLLIDALRGMGAEIEYQNGDGCAPLMIHGRELTGGDLEIDGKVSSQFISALLMASELWARPVNLKVNGEISRPYVEMTKKMLQKDGGLNIESDWSGASYIYAAALLLPEVDIRVASLTAPEDSVQGDAVCSYIYKRIGVDTQWLSDGSAILRGSAQRIKELVSSGEIVEIDLGDQPDLAPAIAVSMAFAGIRFRFKNVAHLRHKECDRQAALKNELAKFGYALCATDDTLAWEGDRCEIASEQIVESYDDHRIAMSFAIAALKLGEIRIKNAGCVSKSFPKFFKEMAKLGMDIQM